MKTVNFKNALVVEEKIEGAYVLPVYDDGRYQFWVSEETGATMRGSLYSDTGVLYIVESEDLPEGYDGYKVHLGDLSITTTPSKNYDIIKMSNKFGLVWIE